MPNDRGSGGLVLVDMLVLLVALALLLAVVVPELTAARRRSAQSALRSDLRALAVAQESYFYDHRVYAAAPPDLQAAGFHPSSGVRVVIHEATQTGWSATAAHPETPVRCFLVVRGAAPVGTATRSGEIACS
jgi:type II secretory pathway pseudopilin PulG